MPHSHIVDNLQRFLIYYLDVSGLLKRKKKQLDFIIINFSKGKIIIASIIFKFYQSNKYFNETQTKY